jgi:hypothetical protein
MDTVEKSRGNAAERNYAVPRLGNNGRTVAISSYTEEFYGVLNTVIFVFAVGNGGIPRDIIATIWFTMGKLRQPCKVPSPWKGRGRKPIQ